jgi:hypothetical protein
MVRRLLLRGMLTGLAAGLLGFGFARLVGEPAVDKAIAFESYVEHTVHHEPHQADLVSRSVQGTAGLGAGALLYGLAFGGIFALVFAVSHGRLGTLTARGTAATLGLFGFIAVCLTPQLKYPANPPSIGNPDTIGRRTQLYLLMILLSVVMMVVAAVLRRRLADRLGEWNATLVAAAAYIGAMTLCYVLLPGVNEVPQQAIRDVVPAVADSGVTFPPAVLWRFRIASLGIQAVMFSSIALTFGALAGRLFEAETDSAYGWPDRRVAASDRAE